MIRPPHDCRLCGAPLEHLVLDLGVQPLSESYVAAERYWEAEPAWPLRAYACADCLLVQVPALVGGEEIFRHYGYFSSWSDTWVEHARRLVEESIQRFDLGPASRMIEVASNDGYLLQHAVAAGIPCLGIDPAQNVAARAIERGVPTEVAYLDRATARRLADAGMRADVLVAINVIGHVPALGEFLDALSILLADGGSLVIEIPHLPRTIEGNQFDQIYQEHYHYWTFGTLERALAGHGMAVWDVEEIPTHGGSMRVWAERTDGERRVVQGRVAELRERERAGGYDRLETYLAWGDRVVETKRRLLDLLYTARAEGRRVAGYGAPGKGNTLLNYCGVREDLIEYVVDRSEFKQGKFLPGSRIPIHPPERLRETKPDVILILAWNLVDEILEQIAWAEEWGATFVVPIPDPRVVRPTASGGSILAASESEPRGGRAAPIGSGGDR